jgi:hypothetical protein
LGPRQPARLTSLFIASSVPSSDAGSNRSFTYDAAGNMLTNSGVGTYTYPAQGPTAVRPHAQTAAGASSFAGACPGPDPGTPTATC